MRVLLGRTVIALSILAGLVIAKPGNVLASCNPGRPEGGAGNAWQSGSYLFSSAPYGVRADLEGYYPYVPWLSHGAQSLETVMLADLDHPMSINDSWIQPGWSMNQNIGLNGYHSFVQVWDSNQSWYQNYYFSDLFSGGDPVPGLNAWARYSALATYSGSTGKMRMDVKLAGVGTATFQTEIFPDSAQIFTEITNKAAQSPGDLSNWVRMKTSQWQDSSGTWHYMASGGSANPTYIGYDHESAGVFASWDKSCPR